MSTSSPGRLGVALLILIATGCSDSSPIEPPAGSANVSGSVTTVKTATGVPNAVVALLQEGDIVRTAFTNTAGNFGFENLRAGDYTARLTALELTGLDLRFVSFAPVEVPFTVDEEPVQLFFAGNGLIPPHVVGDVFCNGAAVSDATVRVVGGEYDQTVQTNPQGRFGATNLSAGNYTVILLSHASSCTFDPIYRIVELLPGQGTTVEFSSS